MHQIGVPAERSEAGQQGSVVRGGLQREAAQRREPASDTYKLKALDVWLPASPMV